MRFHVKPEPMFSFRKRKLRSALATIDNFNQTAKAELASVEPDLIIALSEPAERTKARVLKKSLQKKLCQTISGMPHGVIKMSCRHFLAR